MMDNFYDTKEGINSLSLGAEQDGLYTDVRLVKYFCGLISTDGFFKNSQRLVRYLTENDNFNLNRLQNLGEKI